MQINIVKIDNNRTNIMHQSTVNSCSSTEANNIQLDQNLIDMFMGKLLQVVQMYQGITINKYQLRPVKSPSPISATTLATLHINQVSMLLHQRN